MKAKSGYVKDDYLTLPFCVWKFPSFDPYMV